MPNTPSPDRMSVWKDALVIAALVAWAVAYIAAVLLAL